MYKPLLANKTLEGNKEWRDGKMKTAFTIIRVSHEDQLKGYGVDAQWNEDVLPNAKFLDLEVSEKYRRIFHESATQGDRDKYRRIVDEAIELYKNGEIEAVLFPRNDRETRNPFISMPELIRMATDNGIMVCFASERKSLNPRDLKSVQSYLQDTINSISYSETWRKNSIHGKKQRAKISGKMPCGRGVLFGYDYIKQSKDNRDGTGFNVANKDYDTVRMMGEWLIKDHVTTREIVRKLNDKHILTPRGGTRWGRSSVARILRNSTYAGKTYAYKTVLKDGKRIANESDNFIECKNAIDKPVFTWDEWLEIQKQLSRNRELSPRNKKYDYLVSGFIYCKKCGHKLYGTPVHGKTYYRCSCKTRLYPETYCHSKPVMASWLDTVVWEHFEKEIKDPDFLPKMVENINKRKASTDHLKETLTLSERKLIELNEAQTRYLRLYGAGRFTEDKLNKECDRVKAEIENTQREINRIKDAIDRINRDTTPKDLTEILENFLLGIDGFNLNHKRDTLRRMDTKIWVDDDMIWIEEMLNPLNLYFLSKQPEETTEWTDNGQPIDAKEACNIVSPTL